MGGGGGRIKSISRARISTTKGRERARGETGEGWGTRGTRQGQSWGKQGSGCRSPLGKVVNKDKNQAQGNHCDPEHQIETEV